MFAGKYTKITRQMFQLPQYLPRNGIQKQARVRTNTVKTRELYFSRSNIDKSIYCERVGTQFIRIQTWIQKWPYWASSSDRRLFYTAKLIWSADEKKNGDMENSGKMLKL